MEFFVQDIPLMMVQLLVHVLEEFCFPLQQVVLLSALEQFTAMRLGERRLPLHLKLEFFLILLLAVKADVELVDLGQHFVFLSDLQALQPEDSGQFLLAHEQFFQVFKLLLEISDFHLLVVIVLHPLLQQTNLFEVVLGIQVLILQIKLHRGRRCPQLPHLVLHLLIGLPKTLVLTDCSVDFLLRPESLLVLRKFK